jgi:hypothetical protein
MNPFEVIINGKHYSYPAGTTQDIPDEVAAVIEVHEQNHEDSQAVSSRPAVQPVTHWVEHNEVTSEFNGEDGEIILDGFPAFDVGDTVTLKVDGIEYSLVAFDYEGCPTIGDPWSAIEDGTGEYGWMIYHHAERLSFNFCAFENHSVSYVADVVHKIDKKFLSNSHILYAGGSGPNLYHDSNCTDGVTKEQLMSMVGDIVWVWDMYKGEFMLCVSISDYGSSAKAVLYDNRMCYTIEYNPL